MKPLMTMLVFVLILLNSTSFADTATHGFSIKQDGKPDLVAKANAALPKITKACPGLDRYAADLSSAEVSAGQLLDEEYNSGIVLKFVVADKPQVLPKPLNVYSMKHHCFVSISNKNNKMFIAKRACHSICDGIWKENGHESLGKEYNLN